MQGTRVFEVQSIGARKHKLEESPAKPNKYFPTVGSPSDEVGRKVRLSSNTGSERSFGKELDTLQYFLFLFGYQRKNRER